MDTIEVMGSKLSGTGGDRCGFCSKPGHAEDKCFSKQRDEGGRSSVRDIPRAGVVVPFVTVQSIGKMNALIKTLGRIRGLEQGEGTGVTTLPGVGGRQVEEMVGQLE